MDEAKELMELVGSKGGMAGRASDVSSAPLRRSHESRHRQERQQRRSEAQRQLGSELRRASERLGADAGAARTRASDKASQSLYAELFNGASSAR